MGPGRYLGARRHRVTQAVARTSSRASRCRRLTIHAYITSLLWKLRGAVRLNSPISRHREYPEFQLTAVLGELLIRSITSRHYAIGSTG